VILLGLLAAFSWKVALGVGAVLVVWWWVDYSAGLADRRRRLMGWAFLGLLFIAGSTSITDWLQASASWDSGETLRNSGWIQALFDDLPQNLHMPFILVYGLLQPVLPAAVFDPSLPIWSVITSLRSAGWYLLIPLILYIPFALSKTPRGQLRRFVFIAWAAVVGWTLISSLRAGGDLWDNPRYRTVYLPWMALLAAYLWQNRNHWFWRVIWRWYAIMGIFIAFFTNWYLYRTFNIGFSIEFWSMVAAIVALSALVIVAGVIQEIRKRGSLFTRQ
jgi:hypothetical protein